MQKANAGHPGTAMALAPLAYLLYRRVDASQPGEPGLAEPRPLHPLGRPRLHPPVRDAPSLRLQPLARGAEALPPVGVATPGHPEHFLTTGVETTTGPLGQGFANGVGFGIADRFLAERYNRPHYEIVDRRVYAICSDGDLMEGVTEEAASIAGHLGLGKLVYFYDDNHITIDGTTALTFTTEDKGKRFEAYGWHVQHVDDAEDLGCARAGDPRRGGRRGAPVADRRPQSHRVRRPHAIDTAKSHGAPLGEDEVRAAKEALGCDPDEHFDVSGRGVRAHGRASGGDRGASRSGSSASSAGPRRSRSCARTGSRPHAASRGRAGSRRCRSSRRRRGCATRRRQEGDAGVQALHADDDRRRRRPRRVDEDRVRGRRASSRRPTRAATSRSASASTGWARS